MRARHPILIYALFAVGITGCGVLAPPVEKLRIPCGRNGECPSGYYCLESGRCQPKSKGDPPRLSWVGIQSVGGEGYRSSLTLPRGERTQIKYKLRNTGGSPAESVRVRFSATDCPAFEFSASIVTTRSLPADVTLEDRETVEPDSSCVSPSEITVDMRTATQHSEATFELTLE